MSVSDDHLLELVGRALRAAEPVPDRVLDGARAAWTWRTIDEELAELVFDSASELTGVRSEDTARQLTFRAPGMEIEVMVVDEASRRILGQLVPPGAFEITLLAGDAALVTTPTASVASPSTPSPPAPCASPSPATTAPRRHHGVGAALALQEPSSSSITHAPRRATHPMEPVSRRSCRQGDDGAPVAARRRPVVAPALARAARSGDRAWPCGRSR